MISLTNQIINHVIDLGRITKGKEEYSRFVGNSVGTFGLMVSGNALQLISVIFLARLLGVTEYGAYAYAKTCISMLSVPVVLGLEMLIVRNMAAYQARSEWGLMSGLLHRANQVALFTSIGLAFTAVVVSMAVAKYLDTQMLFTFWVALILLPLIAFTRIKHSALQGLHYVVVGLLPSMLVQPILFIVLIWSTYFLGGKVLTAPWAMGMNILVFIVIFIIIAKLFQKILPQDVKKASPLYQTSLWLRSALPLLFVTGMYIIISGSDTVMLGAMKGAEPVGTYAIAKRGSGLIMYVMMAVNTALAPTIASLNAKGEMKQLQYVVTKSIRATFFVSLPFAVGLVAFGDWFLQIFGLEFAQGKIALAILSTGQIINIAAGSVALLLVMTGHEQDAAIGVAISAVLNIILNAILIPRWGLNGAAVATTISMILLNVLLAIRVYNRLGIHSTVLGKVYFQGEK